MLMTLQLHVETNVLAQCRAGRNESVEERESVTLIVLRLSPG